MPDLENHQSTLQTKKSTCSLFFENMADQKSIEAWKTFDPDCPYYVRFLNEAECHQGMQYQTGINVDPLPFDARPVCGPGGLYFCHLRFFYHWWRFGPFVRSVRVPVDQSEVIRVGTKFKAHALVLGERKHWFSLEFFETLLQAQIDGAIPQETTWWFLANRQDLQPDQLLMLQQCLALMIQTFPLMNLWRMIAEKKWQHLRVDPQLLQSTAPPAWMFQCRGAILQRCPSQSVQAVLDNLFLPFLRQPQLGRDTESHHLVDPSSVDLTWLWEAVHRTKSLVSGSFAMRRFFGQPWVCHDIDIYCPVDLVVHRTKTPGRPNTSFSQLERELRKKYPSRRSSAYGLLNGIRAIRSFQIQGIKVQLIAVHGNAEAFIRSSFDLDVCGAIFDGRETRHLWVEADCRTAHIRPDYWFACFFDGDDKSQRYRMCQTLSRIIKYQDRGFSIPEREDFLAQVTAHLCPERTSQF